MRLPIITFLLCLSLSATAAEPDPFRVTGIITIGDRNVAFVELPDGSQQQLRTGDAFAGGKVLEITPTALRIGFAEAEAQTFTLQGAEVRPDLPEQSFVNSPETPATQPDQQVLQREAVDGRLEETLGRIATELHETAYPMEDPARVDDPAPPVEDQETGASAELTRLVGPLVNLPESTRVIAIDHGPIVSARESIERIRNALAMGNVVTINLEGLSGEQRIYLMPARRGE